MLEPVHALTLMTALAGAASSDAPPAVPPDIGPPAPRLERSPLWSLRAIECMRLEGSTDPAAAGTLEELSRDRDARVRVFATAARVLRGEAPAPASVLDDEDPRVLRAALRAGMEIDPEAVSERIMPRLRSRDPTVLLFAVELAAFVPDDRLRRRCVPAFSRAIMHDDRTVIGSLSPRLGALTGAAPGVRPGDWHKWWQSIDRRGWPFKSPCVSRERAIAAAPSPDYASFARELAEFTRQTVDLTVCIDATRSMWKDLPAAQSAMDAAARTVLDLCPGSRVSLVAYRDRRSEFVTRATPMTEDLEVWRRSLWDLVGDRGGSAAEAVADGLRVAYEAHAWDRSRHNFVILVGDGPPHPGTRGACADMARLAKERLAVRTMVLSAADAGARRPISGFPEIAEAGGGEVIPIDRAGAIPSLMLGGSFGDQWAPMLDAFRARCDLLLR